MRDWPVSVRVRACIRVLYETDYVIIRIAMDKNKAWFVSNLGVYAKPVDC